MRKLNAMLTPLALCFLARFSASFVLHNVFDIKPFQSKNVCPFAMSTPLALINPQKQIDSDTFSI